MYGYHEWRKRRDHEARPHMARQEREARERAEREQPRCPTEVPIVMTEQVDHRAAIAWAVRHADKFVPLSASSSGAATEYAAMTNAARHILHSIKAAWPGVVPKDAVPACDGVPEISYYFRLPSGGWAADGLDGGFDMNEGWAGRANKFERDYPGLKVDEPWLVNAMEGVE